MLDQATHIRSGEELNLEALTQYCRQQLPDITENIEVLQFPSGYSNLTYLLKMGAQEWVLRRPPFGANIKSGHDMAREYRVLSGLKKVYNNIPTPILLCEDDTILGAHFYIMERVHGIIIRDTLPAELHKEEQLRTLSISAIDNLATIHKLDIQQAGLENLGRPNGYVERQISGWTRRYERSKTELIAQMDTISQWLTKNQPSEVAASIIHNDYKYDNLILDPHTLSIKAVLDWEMATLGCPLMDFGCALGYWVQEDDPEEMFSLPLSATRYPGNLSRQEAAEQYVEQTGFAIERLDFYYVYGLWRLAIILQQIYARYKLGYTKDKRFANLIDGVHILAQRAVQVIQTGNL